MSIGTQPHQKKLILTTVLDLHGTWENYSWYSTATEKLLLVATALLFGIMLMFNDKHVDSI